MNEVVASLAGIPLLSGTCKRRHAKAQSRNSGELARLIGFRPGNMRALRRSSGTRERARVATMHVRGIWVAHHSHEIDFGRPSGRRAGLATAQKSGQAESSETWQNDVKVEHLLPIMCRVCCKESDSALDPVNVHYL